MKICKICKTENEDIFTYCKNCGTQLQVSKPQGAPTAPVYAAASASVPTAVSEPDVPAGLVPVTMVLPDTGFPDYRTPQTVYVTPAQKAAIEYSLSRQPRPVPPPPTPVYAQPVTPVATVPENNENE